MPGPPDDSEIDAATPPDAVVTEAPQPATAAPNGQPPLEPAHA